MKYIGVFVVAATACALWDQPDRNVTLLVENSAVHCVVQRWHPESRLYVDDPRLRLLGNHRRHRTSHGRADDRQLHSDSIIRLARTLADGRGPSGNARV